MLIPHAAMEDGMPLASTLLSYNQANPIGFAKLFLVGSLNLTQLSDRFTST